MNKNLLLSLLALGSFSFANAQCDPSAHDWGSAAFGVSPDPQQGEDFDSGFLGEPYSDIVYVKCPSSVADIDTMYEDFDIQIDSISLDSITIFNGIGDVQLDAIGLHVTCNNNNESSNPCMFFPGNAYCGDITGTPTAAGTFDVKIYVTAFFNFFGPQSIPYAFEGYTFHIEDGNLVMEKEEPAVSLDQNSPNPANSVTNIVFNLSQASETQFHVSNLLGEKVFEKKIQGRKGENTFRFDTSELEQGIYLYSIQAGDKKFTRRMIIQR